MATLAITGSEEKSLLPPWVLALAPLFGLPEGFCLWGSHRMGMLRKSDKELGFPGGNHDRAGQGRLCGLRLVTVSLWASKFPSVLGKGPGTCQEGYLNWQGVSILADLREEGAALPASP